MSVLQNKELRIKLAFAERNSDKKNITANLLPRFGETPEKRLTAQALYCAKIIRNEAVNLGGTNLYANLTPQIVGIFEYAGVGVKTDPKPVWRYPERGIIQNATKDRYATAEAFLRAFYAELNKVPQVGLSYRQQAHNEYVRKLNTLRPDNPRLYAHEIPDFDQTPFGKLQTREEVDKLLSASLRRLEEAARTQVRQPSAASNPFEALLSKLNEKRNESKNQ